MKIQSIIATAALLGVMSVSASAITTVAPAKMAPAAKIEAPTPTKVVQPIVLPSRHEGSMVKLTMNIDATGKPSNVQVVSANPDAYKALVATVSQWQFTPARKNGQAVASKAELPLEVKGL